MDMVFGIPVFNSQVRPFIWWSQELHWNLFQAAAIHHPCIRYSSIIKTYLPVYFSIIYAEIVQQQYLDG